jgi:HSP20 family protein
MSASRNPFDELERLFERMNRQIEDASRAWEPEAFGRWRAMGEEMAIDLVEHDDEFVVTVDLPGFERDDVDIWVTDHTLRIRADREESTEQQDEQYLRQERRHESASRSLQLPAEVEKDGVSARMRNGVLTLTLPKIAGEEARRIDIE